MPTIETFKVVHGDSYVIINKDDYDEENHKLWEETDKPSTAPAGELGRDELKSLLADLDSDLAKNASTEAMREEIEGLLEAKLEEEGMEVPEGATLEAMAAAYRG